MQGIETRRAILAFTEYMGDVLDALVEPFDLCCHRASNGKLNWKRNDAETLRIPFRLQKHTQKSRNKWNFIQEKEMQVINEVPY